MNSLRHFLLVIVLLFAQLAAGVHAIEHAAGEREGLPTHVCELCLAAHDLGAALPVPAALPLLPFTCVVPENLTAISRASFPAPAACQRGPPTA